MVITKPKPYCPICGGRMVLRRPKLGTPKYGQFDAFWGCSQYPDCHGKRNIDPETGEAIIEEDEEAILGEEDPYTDWGRD